MFQETTLQEYFIYLLKRTQSISIPFVMICIEFWAAVSIFVYDGIQWLQILRISVTLNPIILMTLLSTLHV